MSPIERALEALAGIYGSGEAAQGAQIPVYRPGEAIGPCKQVCLVVYDGGLSPRTRATAEWLVGVSAYVPLGRHVELEPIIREAARRLTNVGLKPRGSAGPETIDEGFRAHVKTMEFTALCAL